LICFKINPVDYEQINSGNWVPGMKPFIHQQEVFQLTQQAFSEKRFLCIFNQAATGGGKTLASFAYPLLYRQGVIGIYPTNELIKDQKRSLEYLSKKFHFPVNEVDSFKLDEWENDIETEGHARTLENILNFKEIILTNPDIVYLTFFGLYSKSRYSPGLNQRLSNALSDYDIWVFDEFHLYDVKQVGNIITLVGVLHALQKEKRGKVFIFSSATPNDLFLDVLSRLNIEWKVVEGKEATPESENIRRVSHEIEVRLIPAPVNQWKALESILEHFHLIEDFIRQYRDARSVAIIDSVADAVQLKHELDKKFGEKNVGEVHGLSSKSGRETAIQKQHTVGTSSIEVGIDFNDENGTGKDLLIFEAKTASQFTQRLGRIARHAKKNQVPNCSVSLVPGYVYHFIREKLGEKDSVNKSDFTNLIHEAFRSRNQFLPYFKMYTPVEAFDLRNYIRYQMQPDDFPVITQKLDEIIHIISGREIEPVAKSHKWLESQKMLPSLQSFRGHGFESALIDKREKQGNPIKIYDLFFVLRRARFRVISEKEFFRLCYEYEAEYPELVKGKRRFSVIGSNADDFMGVYGYFEIEEILNKARKVWFEIFQNKISNIMEIVLLKGLKIGCESDINLREINNILKNKIFVCRISQDDVWTLNAKKALPPLFHLYELKVKKPNGTYWSKSWSIAFGVNAFFMHSILGNALTES